MADDIAGSARCPFWAVARVAALSVMLSSAHAAAGTFSETNGFGSNPGNLKMFTYVPDRLPPEAPLVLVLHGCNQSAEGYLRHSGWRDVADAGGFALLLPEQQFGPGPVFFPSGRNHLTRCFNFAEQRDSTRGSGETLSIRQMIDRVSADLSIDPDRIYVNGLSAGGGMTSALLAVYPDIFAAGAIIAGLPYRCGDRTATSEVDCGVTLQGRPFKPAPDESPAEWGSRVRAAVPGFSGPWPRVSIWQGTGDGTVDPDNAAELVEQWTNVHGIDAVADIARDADGVRYSGYADDGGQVLVELNEVLGFGHATPIDPDHPVNPCGMTGDPFIRDADSCSTRLIAQFFDLLGVPPSVTITSAMASGTSITLAGTASDADGTVNEVTVQLDGPTQPSATLTTGLSSWTHTFTTLTDNSFYVPSAKATDDEGRTASASHSRVAVGTPPDVNTPPDVSIERAEAMRDCVIVEGRASDPDPDGSVTLVAVSLGPAGEGQASLAGERYTFEVCMLLNGTYPVVVVATDNLGDSTAVPAGDVTVETPVSVSADWITHMNAGRLRLYLPPCPSVGFGSCDVDFSTLFLEFGPAEFALHRAADGADWFLKPDNVR